MKFIKKNWDIILLYLPLIIGVLLFYWSAYATRDVTHEGRYAPLMILLYTASVVGFTVPLFSIIIVVRTVKRKINKRRILWLFPIIIFCLYILLFVVWGLIRLFLYYIIYGGGVSILFGGIVLIVVFSIRKFSGKIEGEKAYISSEKKKIPSWILGVTGIILLYVFNKTGIGAFFVGAFPSNYFIVLSLMWTIEWIFPIWGLVRGVKEWGQLKKKKAAIGIVLCLFVVLILIMNAGWPILRFFMVG